MVMAAGIEGEICTPGDTPVGRDKTISYAIDLMGRWICCVQDVLCLTAVEPGSASVPLDISDFVLHSRTDIASDPLVAIQGDNNAQDIERLLQGATLVCVSNTDRVDFTRAVATHLEPLRTGPWMRGDIRMSPRCLFRYGRYPIEFNGQLIRRAVYRWEIEYKPGVYIQQIGLNCPLDPLNHNFCVLPRYLGVVTNH